MLLEVEFFQLRATCCSDVACNKLCYHTRGNMLNATCCLMLKATMLPVYVGLKSVNNY